MSEGKKVRVHPPKECRELPRSETSYPFSAADRLVEPVELSEYGFEEREFMIKGQSNVYEWPVGQDSPTIRTKDAPYCTRILIRRPADPAKFNGIVVVEPMNYASKYDRSIPGWGHCFEYYLEHGIAWIGVAIRDVALEAMKRFDPERYQELSYSNPLPPEERGEPAKSYGYTSKDSENGLIWDMLSQLCALLKSDSPENPMAGYSVKKVMATAASGGDLSCYVRAVHPLHCLEDEKPVYDGFLIYMTGAPGMINQVTPKLQETDPRCIYYSEVPFIHVLTTGDMVGGGFHPDWAYMQRRPDADEPGKKLHRYEIAGCGVRAGYDKRRCVCREDVEKSQTPWREDVYYEYEFPVRYILRAATEALIRWMNDGVEPPHSPLLEFEGVYPDTTFVRDEVGNTKGGIRTPYVDAPLYVYREEGGAKRLPDETIRRLYKNKEDYLGKVIRSTVKAVQDRFLLAEDSVKIILEAVQESFPEEVAE